MKKHLLLFALLLLISGAMFGQTSHIEVSAIPTEGGTPTINDTNLQAADIPDGQTCTVHANTVGGYHFINWTTETTEGDSVVSTESDYSFLVTRDWTFVANFSNSYVITVSASPETGGEITGAGTYIYGATCELQAIPATGYYFVNWTEEGSPNPVSDQPTYSFEVSGDRNLTANFSNSYVITASANPEAGGEITGAGSYSYGTTCELQAIPATGYYFVNWTEEGSPNPVSDQPTYSFEVSGDRNLTANFSNSYVITASANPEAGGEITGAGSYSYGTTCELQAIPATGYYFVNWTEEGSPNPVSDQPTYSFAVSGDRTLTANFSNNYVITASANPEAGGEITGAGSYSYGTTCELQAIPATGYYFVNWTEEGSPNPVSDQPTYSFAVSGDRTLTANFSNSYVITASANPEAGGEITGAGSYSYGTTCALHASPNSGYVFNQWMKNGTWVSYNPNYSFTVTENATYTAFFNEQGTTYYTIQTNVTPAGAGTVTGSGSFPAGSTTTLTATANNGYTFDHWQDGNTQNPRTITVTGDATYTATFTHDSFSIITEVTPAGSGTVTGAGTYHYGDTPTLTANPNEDYTFAHWQDGNTQNPRTITVTGNATYTATFNEVTTTYYTVSANVSPNGAGTVNGTGTFPEGTTITLHATANNGYSFDHWDDGSTQNPRTVTVTGNITYTAYFNRLQYTITANVSPANSGTVTGDGTYYYNDNCTLHAQPNEGYEFLNWKRNGNVVSYDPDYTFHVTGNATFTANFGTAGTTYYTITTEVTPEGSGSVTGGGQHAAGSTITLTASSSQGYIFEHWQDGVTENPRTVIVTGDATYTAHFTQENYTVNTEVIPAGSGTVTGGGTYHFGETATLKATPNPGFSFQGWNDGSTENPRIIEVTGNATYTATFGEVGTTYYTVTADVVPEGAGTVTGTGTFPADTTTLLKAEPNPGYTFDRWNDGVTLNPRSVTVDGNKDFTAYFTEKPYVIRVSANPEEGGTVAGGGTYHYGDTCTVHATPNEGYIFINWTEDGIQHASTEDYSFIVTDNRTLVANFGGGNDYIIKVDVVPEGTGTITGAGAYGPGEECTLTAYAKPGYRFKEWTKLDVPVSSDPSFTFTVTESAVYVAHFEMKPYTITATADPTEGGTVEGGADYVYGATCRLTAVANDGYNFTNWKKGNLVVSTEPIYSFVVREDAEYIATFTQIMEFNINVEVAPAGSGTVTGGGTFTLGQSCTLKATPASNYSFLNWTEDGFVVNSNATYTFTVTRSHNLVANFQENPCIGNLQKIQPKYYTDGNERYVLILVYPNRDDDGNTIDEEYKYQWWYSSDSVNYKKLGEETDLPYYYEKDSNNGVKEGYYKVGVRKGDCSLETEPYRVNNSSSRLRIYPNPSRRDNSIVIVNDCGTTAQLTIYATDGRVLYTQTVTDDQASINLGLPPGVYVAYLTNSEGYTKVGKLIITQ